ncbi:MAG: hypothetical protein IJY39_02360 [Clostridia bacterium]|nr:hypothetical protein [Clostridia bacterium]
MKKSLFSSLSLLLVLTMLLGAFAACTDGKDETTTEGTSAPIEDITDASTDESGTEEPTETETKVVVDLEGEHADLIELNYEMANGVQAYFTDSSRTHYNFTNKNMTLSYARSSTYSQQVASITNTKGNTYIQDTMDVFIRMKNGNVFYASNSTKSAEANLYRFGYYYYQGLFEFQNFVSKNFEVSDLQSIRANRPNTSRSNQVNIKRTNEDATVIISNASDPFFVYDGFNYDADTLNTLVLTAKIDGNITNCQLFFTTDQYTSFNQARSMSFPLTADGEFHTYRIPLSHLEGYEGKLTALRLDLNGGVGDSITVTEIGVAHAELDAMPDKVSINRHFHVYSDKMHHAVQFATTETTADVAEIGIVTKIGADTVAKIMIKDKNGEHTSLDGIDWASVEAVGFDIKDAGIFGYILPVDEIAGSIKVTLEDGNYVIIQSRVPENNTLIPSIGGTNDKGYYIHADGVENNGNDIYIGQRVYTDENHDFDAFLFETYCERNPLTDKQVVVNKETSEPGASFGGYDALRGIYYFNIPTPSGGFYTPYNTPNKNYRIDFHVDTDEDRDIYIMTAGRGGLLECAALLDKDLMMLPIPIEVIKNFSEATGERNLFNISDPTFSEAIFMLALNKDEQYDYTVLNLYQNWGKYPLKQLSQIPFHCPYYHLSTGVTETNCILPWFGTANVGKGHRNNTLPDFRSMSAPFWAGQPQHNSCGSHSWLEYTNAEGVFSSVECVENTITSYGPTYAEVIMDNVSDDGKIKVSYTHMEMPQLDENRVYYTMEYTVLEDLTIADFKKDFQFYGVTDNDAKGVYKRVGYLNEKNESVVVEANTSSSDEKSYVLGKNCPYFSFFDMPDWNRDSTSAEGYANVAFLVYNSEFVIGGEKVDPNFIIVNSKNHVRISLNLDEVTLKAGDKFTINAILMPWGSQLLDGTYDEVQDNQVREVRKNTLLNPLKVTSDTDTIIESPYLPKVKSADGKTAQFTLSGGQDNVTVRVYGFNMLTAPKIEELVDGKWVEYKVNSAETPDNSGNYHYYDGYGVQYDGDGTYSYSFVTTMTNGAPRTFRIAADTAFAGWPEEIRPEVNPDYLDVYVDAEELKTAASSYVNWFGPSDLSNDGTYFTFTGSGSDANPEAYMNIYTATMQGETLSGQYLVIKYRVPKTNTEAMGRTEFFTSTQNTGAKAGDNFGFNPIADGEWHVAVFDVSKSACKTFTAAADGKFYANYLRIDIFNKVLPTTVAIDIAYVGMDSDLMEICKLNAEEFESIDYYGGGSTKTDLDTTTGTTLEKAYIDPSSGYTESKVAFATQLDYVNTGDLVTYQTTSKAGIHVISGFDATADKTLNIRGWCGVNGGVTKYVWSADGGKTWHDFTATAGDANADILRVSQNRSGATFADLEASKKNGSFQSNAGMTADLSAYAGQTVNVIVGFIPQSDTTGKTIGLMYCFEKVDVPN